MKKRISRLRRVSLGLIIILICLIFVGFLVFAFISKGSYLSLICFFKDSKDSPILTGYTGQIIDAHAHIPPTAPSISHSFYADTLVKAMDRLGVKKIILSEIDNDYSGKGDQALLKVYWRYPDRFYPFLKGFNPADEKSIDYVENQLKNGPWRGLGEIYLRHSDAPKTQISPNHPVMLKIYDLAAQYQVPVLVHHEPDYDTDFDSGIEEMRKALSYNPNTIFIWAHGCHGGNFLISEFNNLYCEFEITENNYFNPNDPFLNKYIIGTDIVFQGLVSKDVLGEEASICELYTPGGKTYQEMITLTRLSLSKINQNLAEKIAYKNIDEILKIKEK